MGAEECVFCEGTCYKQTIVNGTGDCDPFGTNIWWDNVPYVIFLLCFIGICGHIIVFVAVLKYLRHNVTYMLLAGLFVADFLWCVLWGSSHFYVLIWDERYFYGKGVGCEVMGGFAYACCVSNVCHNALIASERYWMVCNPLRKQMTPRTLLRYYTSIWLLAIVLAFCIHSMGGSVLTYSKLYCFADFYDAGNFAVTITCFSIALPIASFCYWKVYWRLQQMVSRTHSSQSSPMRSAARAFMVVYVFMMACWSPNVIYVLFMVAGIISWDNSAGWDVAAHIFVTINASLNPLLALYLFPKLGSSAKKLFGVSSVSPYAVTQSPKDVAKSVTLSSDSGGTTTND